MELLYIHQYFATNEGTGEHIIALHRAARSGWDEAGRTLDLDLAYGTEKMLVEFGKASLLAKAKAQPDKVKQVLDKIKFDGLLPTLEAVFNCLDEPLPLGYCNADDMGGSDDCGVIEDE